MDPARRGPAAAGARCAVYNGTLGSGFGQRFELPVGLPSEMPMAA